MRLSKVKLIEATLLLVSATGISFLLVKSSNTTPGQPTSPATLPPARAEAPGETNEAASIDASQKLVMKVNKSLSSTTFVFSITDESGGNPRLLFTKTEPAGGSMSLPQNSWSPDGHYVFISETQGNETRFLVLKASGEAFADGQKYLEVVSLFAKNAGKYHVMNVTGWDGYGLLHVQTATDQGARGPNFWFEVDSRSFLELAS